MDGIVKWIYTVNLIGAALIVRTKSKDTKIATFDMTCRAHASQLRNLDLLKMLNQIVAE